MRHVRGLVASWLVLTILAVGAASAAAAPEGQLTWAVHISLAPTWFDPAETSGIITPYMVLYALHDALVKPMPGQPLAPSLAESWSASEDGLGYDFVLRQGVKFHNGDPVTAEDVKFSYERYRGAGAKELQTRVRQVDIVDALTIRFQLKEPWPDFMTFYGTTATAAGIVVPKKYLERVGDETFRKNPIGAGPYKFVSHTPGVELVMEAYEGYWRKTPTVKRIVYKSVPEATTRLAMLKRGEVDIAYLFDGPMAEEVKRDPNLKLAFSEGIGITYVDFLDQWDPKSPWHDRRVRLAASLARRSTTPRVSASAPRPASSCPASWTSRSRSSRRPTTPRRPGSSLQRPATPTASTPETSSRSRRSSRWARRW